MRIAEEHIAHWRRHGYVIVPDVLTPQELEAARANVHLYMPTAEEYAAAPQRYRPLSSGMLVNQFPFQGNVLNNICTHPEVIAFAEHVLGTRDIALSHSQLVGKYAGAADYEQALHLDSSNNTLAYPKDDDEIVDIPMILYYSDVTADHGPTYVVSQEHTRGQSLWPNARQRAESPELYDHEVPATASAGSILIYSMRTWHRGSAFHATAGARFRHHMGLRAGAYRWLGQSCFQHDGGRPEMDRFIKQATPRQREVVGFPPPGHRYWDDETLAGVAARYPGMDMTPYTQAAGL